MCNYNGYNIDNQQSGCTCKIKYQMDTISEIIDKPNKLASLNISEEDSSGSSSNLLSLECPGALFSKEGLQKNISSYIITIIMLYRIFSVLCFMKCGFPLLRMEMNKILKSKEQDSHKDVDKQETKAKRIRKNKVKHSKKTENNPPKKLSGKLNKKDEKNRKKKNF